MSACPCCLEPLTPALLGLGGRRLAGNCQLCGDAVCKRCLHARTCASCWWDSLIARGQKPSFPEPPGRRRRAAQATCSHSLAVRWMRCCPSCGAQRDWPAEHGNPSCDACGAPSYDAFNACWACGESFEEDNAPEDTAQGYALAFDCRSRTCEGRVAWLMPFCPWCATAQHWQPSSEPEAPVCLACEARLDPTWAFCVGCGEEAPLPKECFCCAASLEQAGCAARCAHCRRMVCGDCCGEYTLPRPPGSARTASPKPRELLLCTPCAEELGAAPLTEEPEPASEPEPEPEPEPRAAPRPALSGPWEVLGVAPGTPLPEVKRAYLALITQYHPDKVAQLGPKLQALAAEETRRLNQAWSELRQRGRKGPR